MQKSTDNIQDTDQSISYSQALQMVRARWPKAFKVSDPCPLKIGIHKDMKEIGEFSVSIINKALKFFTSQERYLVKMKVGRVRIDLEGQPSGKVKLKDAVNAEIMLFNRWQDKTKKNARVNVGQLRLVAIGASDSDTETVVGKPIDNS